MNQFAYYIVVVVKYICLKMGDAGLPSHINYFKKQEKMWSCGFINMCRILNNQSPNNSFQRIMDTTAEIKRYIRNEVFDES